MEFDWSEQEVTYRREIKDFLEAELPADWGYKRRRPDSDEQVEQCKEFCGKLAARGWLTPHWPKEYGGNDAPAWQHMILGEELWSIGEPRGPQYMNVNWIGPSIMAAGTAQQKQYHLNRISRGDVIWCQGFSEPDAGSDLASLRTRAERDGDGYVIDGQKIWTSYANAADFCYLLARTNPDAPKHKGISIFLVPIDTPGLEVRDVHAVVGEHAFHQLTFTDMAVSADTRLGPENEGWGIIRAVLSNERVGVPRYGRAMFELGLVAQWSKERGMLADPEIASTLASAQAKCEAARALVYKVVDERAKGQPPSPSAYVARVAMVQAEWAVANAGMLVMGAEGLELDSIADDQFRFGITAGVAGGTYEIQLNLVANLALDLPRS
jgi:alkylation response protein AidB-like acyl-CoA dehydrogenase